MPYAFLSFSVIWVFLFRFLLRQMRVTRREIAYLPQIPDSKKILGGEIMPSIGKNLTEIVPKGYLKNTFTIVGITSPTCSFCHSAIEEFIEINKKLKAPFLNLLVYETDEGISDFVNLYKNLFTIAKVPVDAIRQINIDAFPTFLIINKNGEIIHETNWVKASLLEWNKITQNNT